MTYAARHFAAHHLELSVPIECGPDNVDRFPHRVQLGTPQAADGDGDLFHKSNAREFSTRGRKIVRQRGKLQGAVEPQSPNAR